MNPGARGSGGRVLSTIFIVLTIALAVAWSLVTRRELAASIAQDGTRQLAFASTTFQSIRARTLDNLRAHCRVMVEDPRLKSTLATEGVDQATIADILSDLAKLRRAGFLMVLSPDGQVIAEVGADELRGLDLSESRPVKTARGSPDAAVGSWVIGGTVMDISVMGVRFGETQVAYLVVGQAVDQDMLNAVAEQTGVAAASAAGEAIKLSSAGAIPGPVFAAVAGQAGSFRGRLLELEGRSYLTAVSELEDAAQSRPRLVLVQPLAQASASFETLQWLIFIPPVLVVIAALCALAARRRPVS